MRSWRACSRRPSIQRFGSARVATVGIVGLAGALVLVGLAPSWAVLAAILFVAGGIDAVTDVGQNAHGLRVQHAYGRSIVNSFHGIWSIGAVFGGLMGAATIALGVSLEVALVAASLFFAAVALVSYRFLLRGPDDTERAQRPRSKVSRSTLPHARRTRCARRVSARSSKTPAASWARYT